MSTPASSVTTALRDRPWLDPVLCAGLGLAVYASLIVAGFTLDDGLLIVGLDERGGESLASVFTRDLWAITPGDSGYYRPLTALHFMVVHQLVGPSTMVFHGINVVLHLAVGALVWVLARAVIGGDPTPVNRGSAALAMLVFLLHPMQQEAIAFVAAVNDLWAALFVAACALMWVRGRWLLASAALLVGLLFKENAGAVILFALAWDLDQRKPRPLPWAALAGAVIAYGTLRIGVAGAGFPPGVGVPGGWTIAAFWAHYASVAALPVSVGAWRPLRAAQEAWWCVPALALALATVVVACKRYRAIRPGLALTVVGLVAALPTVVRTGFLSDRFVYLPMIGLALAAGVVVSRGPARFTVPLGALFVCVALATNVMTLPRWQDQTALMRQSERRDPSGLSSHELGKSLAAEGRPAEAVVAFERAASARWPYPAAYGQLAAMHLTLGDTTAALHAIDTGLELGLEPSWTLYVNRATCCRALGRYDEALEDLRRAAALAPNREIDVTIHAVAVARAAGRVEDVDAFVRRLATLGVPEGEAHARAAAVLGEPIP